MKRYEYAELVNGSIPKKDYPCCEFTSSEGKIEIKGTLLKCLNIVGQEGWKVISQVQNFNSYSIIKFYLEREMVE